MAISGALASVAIDHGAGVRTVAFSTGIAMLLPAMAWLWALRFWGNGVRKSRFEGN
jgi:hypothetical protein